MADPTKVHTVLDIRGVTCPITFVKTKLVLEKMASGEVIRVVVDAASAADNVPRSLAVEGHVVLGVTDTDEGVWEIVAFKRESARSAKKRHSPFTCRGASHRGSDAPYLDGP